MSDQTDLFAGMRESAPDADVSLVVPLQCPIRVFTNNEGGVTIAQDQMGAYGEDVFIWMNDAKTVRAVIAALAREIGER